MADDLTCRAAEPRQGERPARLIGPDDFGVNSRIDVYLRDGCDKDGEEYGERHTHVFDDVMIGRAADAMGTSRRVAQMGLFAALQPRD